MAGARDWLESDNPSELIKYARMYPGADLDRALKFFALHCCRLALPAMPDARSANAIDTAERELVGLATADELAAALLDANAVRHEARGAYEVYAAAPATRADSDGRAVRMSDSLGAHIAFTTAHVGHYDGLLTHFRDALAFRGLLRGVVGIAPFRLGLCDLLREVLANPFRRPAFAPEWRTDTASCSRVRCSPRTTSARCRFWPMPFRMRAAIATTS